MYKYNTPQELFTAICDKIRDKTNSNELINHQDIPDKINKLTNNDIKLFIDSAIQGKNTTCYSFNNTTITEISSEIFSMTNVTTVDLPKCTSICCIMAFFACTNLTTINLPKCTYIGGEAFASCKNLTTINLPECTSIGDSAFSNCTNLTTVNLPKCTYIECEAFRNCTNLTTIILSNNQVAYVDVNVFGMTPIAANGVGYVYVPDNLVDSYKTATTWSKYANQIKPISELPSELKEEYGYE